MTELVDVRLQQHEKQLADAWKRLGRLYDLIESGTGDPGMLAPRINSIQSEIRAVEASAPSTSARRLVPAVDRIAAMLDSLYEVANEVFGPEADPETLNAFFRSVNLQLTYDRIEKRLAGSADLSGLTEPASSASQLGVAPNVSVRGGT